MGTFKAHLKNSLRSICRIFQEMYYAFSVPTPASRDTCVLSFSPYHHTPERITVFQNVRACVSGTPVCLTVGSRSMNKEASRIIVAASDARA